MAASKSIIRRIDETGIALLVLRFVLGILFVWMGWNKVVDPVGFLKQIHLYDLLPESPGIFLNATAIVLPWVEIVCGVALLLGVLLRGASSTLATMLLVFTPAILLRALGMMAETGTPFFELSFDCGCGAGEVVTWTKLLENTALFLATILIFASSSRRFCLALWLERRKPVSDYCGRCGYRMPASSTPICESSGCTGGFRSTLAEAHELVRGADVT